MPPPEEHSSNGSLDSSRGDHDKLIKLESNVQAIGAEMDELRESQGRAEDSSKEFRKATNDEFRRIELMLTEKFATLFEKFNNLELQLKERKSDWKWLTTTLIALVALGYSLWIKR